MINVNYFYNILESAINESQSKAHRLPNISTNKYVKSPSSPAQTAEGTLPSTLPALIHRVPIPGNISNIQVLYPAEFTVLTLLARFLSFIRITKCLCLLLVSVCLRHQIDFTSVNTELFLQHYKKTLM